MAIDLEEARKKLEAELSVMGSLTPRTEVISHAVAMARIKRKERILYVLRKIACGEFTGKCNCGELIDDQRLKNDPSVLECKNCAEARESAPKKSPYHSSTGRKPLKINLHL